MSTVRLRRLTADYQKVADFATRHPRLQLIQVEGAPPERYQIEYRIRSIRQKDDGLEEVRSHLVEIALPRNYPRVPPQCRMLTPIFHPNIAPHAICIGDNWSSGEPLASIIARIGEMIAYQSYNTKSPLNGEAARWVSEHESLLPLDPVNMDMEDPTPAAAPAAMTATAPQATAPQAPAPATDFSAAQADPPSLGVLELPPDVAEFIAVTCASCSARLRLPAAKVGKAIRCPRCKTVMTVRAGS